MGKQYVVLVYNKIESNNFFKVYTNKEEAIDRARFEYAAMQELKQKFPKSNNKPICVQLVCLENFHLIDFLKEDDFLRLINKQ